MKKIKAIITGATGMIGHGVLIECLENDQVEKVLIIVRSKMNIDHPKLEQVVHEDFFDLTPIIPKLVDYNACFFCLGISSAGISKDDYYKTTYSLTMHFASVLLPLSPDVTFCFISGAGTSTNENSSQNWANVKGKAENDLLTLPFKKHYMFRPGFIQPMKGVESKVPMYKKIYKVLGPLYPVIDTLFPKYITSTPRVGKAMINAAVEGYENTYLENADINILAGR
ncbi:epimerase [Flammeovirga sp. SubArs3]|uniref:epimerase n=1 Tax=Flammeovirga sp. SubArs3 TaxID=2995316 RepID=UPI00248ADAA0|nr:epimerase [Flammeovirga sp. SubArs3]